MLIILEGSDQAGKSTLARHIRARIQGRSPNHSIRVIHKGPPEEHPLREYENPLFWYRPTTRNHVICDRWHIGERVYPQVLGRYSMMSTTIYDHIELFLRSRGALLVHVTAPIEVLAARLATEAKEHPNRSLIGAGHLVKAASGIETEVRLSSLGKMAISTEHTVSDNTVDMIIREAQRLEKAAAVINPFVTYVGPPRPRLLLVGDVRHDFRTMHTDLAVETLARSDLSPAFGPYPGTSGDYLLQAVGAQVDLGLINANDVDDAELAWLALGRPPTVALGRKAWGKVAYWKATNESVRIGAAPHPQYWRRFFNRHMDDYAAVVHKAADDGEDYLAARPQSSWLDRVG